MHKKIGDSSKASFFFAVFLSLILAGCQNQLPPEPGSPSVPVGKATAIYDGYSPPKDVFDGDKQIMFLSSSVFNLESGKSSIDVGVKVSHDSGFVYKYGHYYSNSGWRVFEFSDPTVAGSSWIKDSAATSLNINTYDITPGENYIVAYSCKKYDGTWKCGCTSTGGPCNQWMLQTYLYRTVELPPEPIPPGGLITTRAYIYPNWLIFKKEQETWPSVYLESTRDNLKDIPDELSLRITKPDYTPEIVALHKTSDINCYECPDESCYRQFSCSLSFLGNYKPSLEGEYYINFGRDVKPPEWMKVENGRFKVVDQKMFDEYLIESDIGGYILSYSGGYYSESGQAYFAYYSPSLDKGPALQAYINDFKESFSGFQAWKSDPRTEIRNVEGNEVFAIGKDFIFWNSYGRFININSFGDSDPEAIVSAYLKKYPSNNIKKEELYLILEDIGDFKFEESYADDYLHVANYVSSDGLSSGKVSVSIYPEILDKFKSIIKYGTYEQFSIGDSILYKKTNRYPLPDGRYTSEIIWMSEGKMISIRTLGPNADSAEVLAAAYLKKHPSDNIIVELEHYPDILIEKDIDKYKYQRSVLITESDDKTKVDHYRALYTYDTSQFTAGVIKSDNQAYLDELIKNEILPYANLSKIDGQNVYLYREGQYTVWTLPNVIVYTGDEDGREPYAPIEITKAYLAKYPSTIPDDLVLEPGTESGTAALKSSIFDVVKIDDEEDRR